jgi:hypothetical protein
LRAGGARSRRNEKRALPLASQVRESAEAGVLVLYGAPFNADVDQGEALPVTKSDRSFRGSERQEKGEQRDAREKPSFRAVLTGPVGSGG